MVLLLIAATVLRVLSVGWNSFSHADVSEDAMASASFLQTSTFFTEPGGLPRPDEAPMYDLREAGGRLLTQHPFLWPLLGAGLTKTLGWPAEPAATFLAFRILSLLSGMALILCTYAVTRKLVHDEAAMGIAAWMTFSYLLIDYSGNGAFYVFQGTLYLLWILAAANIRSPRQGILLGLLCGIAYITNYQTLILVPCSIIVLCMMTERPWKDRLTHAGIAIGVFLVFAIPWHVRDYLTFGDPFFSSSVNASYVYGKAGIAPVIADGIARYSLTLSDKLVLIQTVLTTWLPNNLYYIARKLFILAPLAFPFFAFGLVEYLFSVRQNYKRIRPLIPLLLILAVHILVSAAWPVVKFRYFVPMLPLVLIVTMEYLYGLRISKTLQRSIVGTVLACILLLSWRTYLSVPTHTYYYDGAITTDPFSAPGEFDYVQLRFDPSPTP